MSDPIFVECPLCNGSAEELRYICTDWVDGPQYSAEKCSVCDGHGTIEADGEPVTLADLLAEEEMREEDAKEERIANSQFGVGA